MLKAQRSLAYCWFKRTDGQSGVGETTASKADQDLPLSPTSLEAKRASSSEVKQFNEMGRDQRSIFILCTGAA